MEYSGSLCIPQLSLQENVSIPKILIEDKEISDHDIYCEVQYPPSLASGPESTYSHSPSFTASSTSFRLAGGRLGAIATRLERAITRWARANWADSSASLNSDIPSSGSSRSSFRTANKSTRRKHHHPSATSIQQRASFERTVEARLRAREARRDVRVPREFNLYSPFKDSPSQGPGPVVEERQQVVRTFSLDLMLPHLETSLRRRGKSRRARPRVRATVTEPDCPDRGRALWRDGAGNSSRVDEIDEASHRLQKGKDKMASAMPPPSNAPKHPSVPLPVSDPEAGKLPPAWWLDVANPSWEDMRTLGKLLHLHPLTLEDILQREPREKLESFPKLGYYFIVIRALESSTAPERLDTISQKSGSSQPQDNGVVNWVNVYLVVFRGGICTFHFSDISKHLDRVRRKLQITAQTTRKSSAWIVHGILGSIVDSFFPIVEEIGKEVMATEAVVYNEDSPGSIATVPPISVVRAQASGLTSEEKALPQNLHVDEKHVFFIDVASMRTTKTESSLPRLAFGPILRRAFFGFIRLFKPSRSKSRNVNPSVSHTSSDLRRMARTRRLVTSLVRVLATKPEVVAGIRKRLMTADRLVASDDDAEVGMYFGDVQDHILSLQQSLAHYERMLSQSHPTYLENLRVDFFRARAKADYAGFIFTIVNMLVVLAEVPIGMFSMNVQTPHNTYTGGELRWFAGIVVATLCLHASFLGLVRYWWVNAKRNRHAL